MRSRVIGGENETTFVGSNPLRLSWENYALALANTAALRSEDPFKKVGACALRYDKSVAGIGYNGAPRGVEIDWTNRDERRKRVIHAEINCLSYCQPNEVWLLASTLLPCSSCMRVIAAHGVKKIVFHEIYNRDDFTFTLAKEFGIELVQQRPLGRISGDMKALDKSLNDSTARVVGNFGVTPALIEYIQKKRIGCIGSAYCPTCKENKSGTCFCMLICPDCKGKMEEILNPTGLIFKRHLGDG